MVREEDYEFKQITWATHPAYLPNFMDGISYSFPFIAEQCKNTHRENEYKQNNNFVLNEHTDLLFSLHFLTSGQVLLFTSEAR